MAGYLLLSSLCLPPLPPLLSPSFALLPHSLSFPLPPSSLSSPPHLDTASKVGLGDIVRTPIKSISWGSTETPLTSSSEHNSLRDRLKTAADEN